MVPEDGKTEAISGEVLPQAGFELDFDHTNDPRKGVPYAARLFWDNASGKVERAFYELGRSWGRKSVTVYGTYRVHAGEVIEIRTGGSWKNDYRDWHLVSDTGTLIFLCSNQSSHGKSLVERFLRGTLTAEQLISKLKGGE